MGTTLPVYGATFEQFLEAVPDGIVLADPDGRIVLANPQMAALTGYTREELLGLTVEDLVPARLRSAHVRHRTAYQDQPSARPMGTHLEIRCRRKDGSEFPADIALSAVTSDPSPLFVASVRDITQRKLFEAELLKAQEGFRQVVEGVHDYAIFMLDADGRVSTWSPAAEQIMGYPAEEIVGRHFSVFYPVEEVAADKPVREVGEARATGRCEDEGWRIRSDGSRFWASTIITALYDEGGQIQGFAKVTRDVSERKHIDDRLRALLEVAQSIIEGREDETVLRLVASRARSLVDADLAAVAIVDPADGSFVIRTADGRDAAAFQGLHIPSGSGMMADVVATGKPAALDDVAASVEAAVAADRVDLDRLPEEAKPMLDAALKAGPTLLLPLASGERRFGALIVVNRPGGPRFSETDVQLLEVFAAQAAVAIDYARVRGELQQLAILQDRERIGRELHDGAIQALFAVGMGLQGVALTADAGLRERLEGSVAQIDEVIRDLRNYIFGLRPGIAADRHLGQALADLAAQLHEQHGVACTVDVDQALASRLAGRAADLVQFTREALSNVGRHAAAKTCRVSLRPEAGSAALEIQDDGRGFVPDAAHGEGWGLRNLVDRGAALGGSLTVTSAPDQGTTVRLLLPL